VTTARLLGPFGEVVEHHGRPPSAPSGPDDRGELRTPAQACLRGQHVRRRASRDPCADGRRGSRGPRGCASAAGSRGSSTAGDCSAGTCACSRGTPTTRHRRCAPAGGRARGGWPDGDLPHPDDPGSWSLQAAHTASPAVPHCCTDGERRPEPSTDSSQHNRGKAGCRRPGGTRSPMIHPAEAGVVAARRSRRARASRSIVAGLWTKLLASPSLRVGRQGHGARADPVGHPTAEPSVLPPLLAPDLHRS
jgi:hypothetical protein